MTVRKRGELVGYKGRTFAVGVAIYPTHGENFEELVQIADAAMYRMKVHPDTDVNESFI